MAESISQIGSEVGIAKASIKRAIEIAEAKAGSALFDDEDGQHFLHATINNLGEVLAELESAVPSELDDMIKREAE